MEEKNERFVDNIAQEDNRYDAVRGIQNRTRNCNACPLQNRPYDSKYAGNDCCFFVLADCIYSADQDKRQAQGQNQPKVDKRLQKGPGQQVPQDCYEQEEKTVFLALVIHLFEYMAGHNNLIMEVL